MSSNPFSSEYVGSPATQSDFSVIPTAPSPTTTTALKQAIPATSVAPPAYGIEVRAETYVGGKPRRVIIRGKIARD